MNKIRKVFKSRNAKCKISKDGVVSCQAGVFKVKIRFVDGIPDIEFDGINDGYCQKDIRDTGYDLLNLSAILSDLAGK